MKNKLKLISEEVIEIYLVLLREEKYSIIYLHSREIIQRLADKSLDLGFSGFDLLKENELTVQNKIKLKKYVRQQH